MTLHERPRAALRRHVLRVLSLGAALCACILTDKEIEFEDARISNRNPVRLAEPTVLSQEADLACDRNKTDMRIDLCPQPGTDPGDALPHFLDPNYIVVSDDSPSRPWYFCTCPTEQIDRRALVYDLYVEDQDEKPRSRDPRDSIYAAFFLDLRPGTDRPDDFLEYNDNLNPQSPLDLADTDYEPIYRRDAHLRQLPLGTDALPLDLCNGGRSRLATGLHTLTVMVTDRPWFSNVTEDVPIQVGTPDLASGATFDTITYVFQCADGVSDPLCACDDEDADDEGAL